MGGELESGGVSATPPGPCAIAIMASAHLPAVAGLCADLGYAGAAGGLTARFKALAADPDHGLFVAVVDGAAVGFIHVHVRPMLHDHASAQVQAMAVAAPHRRRGIGAMLLGRAEAWARDRGLAAMMLYSADGRDDAHGFYAALGYRPAIGLSRFDKALAETTKQRQA